MANNLCQEQFQYIISTLEANSKASQEAADNVIMGDPRIISALLNANKISKKPRARAFHMMRASYGTKPSAKKTQATQAEELKKLTKMC